MRCQLAQIFIQRAVAIFAVGGHLRCTPAACRSKQSVAAEHADQQMTPQTGAHTFLKWLCPDRRSHHLSGTLEAGGSSILASTSCLSVATAMRIFPLNHDVRTKQRERTGRMKLLSGTA